VGAGIAGLALARALIMRGASVEVYEQAPAITEVGAGIQLSPNGVCVLDALELGDELRALAIGSPCTDMFDHSGKPVISVPQDPDRYFYIHRAALIGLLEKSARSWGVTIKTGLFVTHVDVRTAQLSLANEIGEDLGKTASYDVILAGNGIKSAARDQINPETKAKFSGQVAWRALIPDAACAPGGSVFMGPGKHVVSYRLRGDMRNIVAVHTQRDWADEGWSQEGDPEDLRARFADFGNPVRGWLEQASKAHKWGLFLHPVAQRWFEGRLALLGDAAHPTLPFMAQGANLALEDAWTLAALLQSEDHYGAAFARFQAVRKPRVEMVLGRARQNARNFHFAPPLQKPAHVVLKWTHAIAPQRIRNGLEPIYGYDVTSAFPMK